MTCAAIGSHSVKQVAYTQKAHRAIHTYDNTPMHVSRANKQQTTLTMQKIGKNNIIQSYRGEELKPAQSQEKRP